MCPKVSKHFSCFVELLVGTGLGDIAGKDNKVPRSRVIVQPAKIFKKELLEVRQEPILAVHANVQIGQVQPRN